MNVVDDGTKVQLLQLEVLAGEVRNEIERFQNYGFTSVPLQGAEAVVVFENGRREHGLVVAVDDRRHRLTGLAPGEVAVYSDSGAKVVLKASGEIELTPKAGQKVKIVGGLEVTGDVIGAGKSLVGHTHSAGTLTSPSGAVTGTTGSPT